MADTNIDAIFKEIEKDFVKLSKDAARSAANKAQEDIRQKADKFIDEYYQYKPKRYTQRKYALYKLVQKYYKEKEHANGITIEFGVEYDSSQIKGLHQSSSPFHQSGDKWISRDSSGFNWNGGDNGIPEAEWITNKFLAGEHPWAQTDSQSSDEKMQDFFDAELDKLVEDYISSSLMGAISEYF